MGSAAAIYNLLYKVSPHNVVMGVSIDMDLEGPFGFIGEIDGHPQKFLVGGRFERTGVGGQLNAIHPVRPWRATLDLKDDGLPVLDPAVAIHDAVVVVGIDGAFHPVLAPAGTEGILELLPPETVPRDGRWGGGRASLVP
jgi:hypothetical protein|tara:strand:- start:640 stop:1059 length:420 start_codon:yes stop_codon:yes gene_type:complete